MSAEQLELLGKSMAKFGDLSGIIVNVRSGHLVGGHQRLKQLDPKWPILKRSYRDSTGTIAIGYIQTPWGKFQYREVSWVRAKELAANVAANKLTGDWDAAKLVPILEELRPLPEFDLTGFTADEITEVAETVDIEELEENASGTLTANNKVNLTVVPYLGGKHRLVKQLLPLIPAHEIFVEVFGGAANVLLNKPPSKKEVYNDIDGEMVNLLMQIRDNVKALQERARTIPYSRELFERWRQDILHDRVDQLDPAERAARYYYIMRAAYAGAFFKGWGYHRVGGESKDARAFQGSINGLTVVSQRLVGQVDIDRLDFSKCIEHWDSPDTFFYVDPPYYDIESRDYRHQMSEEQHRQLAEMLRRTKGKWLLNYAYHPKIREFYHDYPTRILNTNASVKKAELGETRGLKVRNLVITNYDPDELKERPFATVMKT